MASSTVLPSTAIAQELTPSSEEGTYQEIAPVGGSSLPGEDDRPAISPEHVIVPPTGGVKMISFSGIDFVPRSSAMTYESSTGCIKWKSGPQRAVIDLHLPSGSKILGVEYRHTRLSEAESYLFLVSYPADGTFTDLLSVLNGNTIGYQEIYGSLSGGYEVDNYEEALSLVWSTDNDQTYLCGATVYYEEGPAPLADQYVFYTGQSLIPIDGSTTKNNVGPGCSYRPSGDHALVGSIDLPAGTRIYGYRLYYFNNGDPGRVRSFLQEYDGAGDGLVIASLESTLSSGYHDEYISITESYYINPNQSSLSIVLYPGNSINLAVCGLRLYVQYPANSLHIQEQSIPMGERNDASLGEVEAETSVSDLTAPDSQNDSELTAAGYLLNIAGSTFHPVDSNVHLRYSGFGCVYTDEANALLVSSIVLPRFAKIKEVRYQYYHDNPNEESFLYVTLSGSSMLYPMMLAKAEGQVGYGVVSNSEHSFVNRPELFSINFAWLSVNNTSSSKLCGAQIVYEYNYPVYLPMIFR